MKIKILQSVTSHSYSYAKGQIVEVSKERASDFIKHSIAEPVKAEAKKKATAKKSPAKKKADK